MSLWLNTKRVARYGLAGFVRNGFISLAAVVIMTITLFVLAGLLISGAALTATLKSLTDKVDVSVYFTTTASEAQIMDVQNSLKTLPEVASINFGEPREALPISARHKNDQLTIQALDELGGNPLGASLEVRAKQTSQYESIAKYLDTMQAAATGSGAVIDKVNFYQNKTAIDRLTTIIDTSRRLGYIVALVLGLASLLITFNTIRLAIYTSRDEIGVMNLVGASHWYVRGPFMIAGLLYGVVSATAVLLVLYPLAAWLGPASQNFSRVQCIHLLHDNFAYMFFVLMLSASLAGFQLFSGA